ncbi:MFS transporter [Pseudooceanicola onchidii]|uniref:MFS transporter n=1 Tax=Pseudooceanicola onchidii TaxID=2562279 RepID=UPI0010AA6D6A|nr:MFS transporter [Pseudooceanicola onchidii]
MTPVSTASAPAPRSAVVFVFVTVLIDMIGVGLIFPVMPALLQDVGHMDLSQASVIGGWMFAAFSLAQFLAGPLVGNLSDAYGRRPLLLLAIGGLALDYVLSALAPTIWLLFIGRAIAGLCGSSYIVANAFLTDITAPQDRARAFGLVGAAFGMGFVFGPAIGGILGEFGPRVPFWAAAGLAAANFVFGALILPESLPPEKRRPFRWRRANPIALFTVFRGYPSVLPLAAILTLYHFAGSAYPTLWSFWGIAQFGWTELTIGATLALFGTMAAVVEGGLSGPFVRWFGEHRLIVAGLLIGTGSALGFGLATTTTAVIVLLVIVSIEGLVNPCLTSLMTAEVPDDAQGELHGGLSSLANLAMLFGALFFTQTFGWFIRPEATTPSPGAPFMICAGLYAVAFLGYLWVSRRPVT